MNRMNSFWKISAIAILLSSFSSCNFTGKITRRYKSFAIDEVGCKIKEKVQVKASIVEKESPSPLFTSLSSLTERGQVAFINAINSKETTSAGVIDKLKVDLTATADKKPNEISDFTRISKRIMINVDKVKTGYGERIEGIKVKITIIDSNFVLRSCNRTSSEYMVVDQGKLNYSNSNSLELTGNAGFTGVSSMTSGDGSKNTSSEKSGDNTLGSERTVNNGLTNSGTVTKGVASKFSASRTFNEEVQLKQRIVSLSGYIENNVLHIREEGISGIDLNGTLTVDIIAEYLNNIAVDKVYSFGNLFAPGGAATPQATIEVKENFIQYINVSNDISAFLSFEADVRTIKTGARTISEADDEIVKVSGATSKCDTIPFVLIPKESIKPKRWNIMLTVGGSRLPLEIDNTSTSGELLFSSMSNAIDFLRWLKSGANLSNGLGVRGYKIVIGGRAPTITEINSGNVFLVN